jgi:hypothetical protein
VSVITFWGSKNGSIFFNSNFSERKVNVDGILASQKSILFKSFEKKNKKITKKQEFLPRFG